MNEGYTTLIIIFRESVFKRHIDQRFASLEKIYFFEGDGEFLDKNISYLR